MSHFILRNNSVRLILLKILCLKVIKKIKFMLYFLYKIFINKKFKEQNCREPFT